MSSHLDQDRPQAPPLAQDPVCGMQVDLVASQHRLEHEGRTFVFCSQGCRVKFAADSTSYLDRDAEHHGHQQAAVPATGEVAG